MGMLQTFSSLTTISVSYRSDKCSVCLTRMGSESIAHEALGLLGY